MLNEEQSSKLTEYLLSMQQVKSPNALSIGAILVSDDQREEVKQTIIDQFISVIETDQHPDMVLKPLIENIKEGKVTVLDLAADLDFKISNQLSNLTEGRVNVHLAGDEEPTVIQPIPEQGALLLLMNDDTYSSFPKQQVISTVCRLNR